MSFYVLSKTFSLGQFWVTLRRGSRSVARHVALAHGNDSGILCHAVLRNDPLSIHWAKRNACHRSTVKLGRSICSSFSRSSQRLLPVFSTDHMEYYSLQAVAVAEDVHIAVIDTWVIWKLLVTPGWSGRISLFGWFGRYCFLMLSRPPFGNGN